MFESINRQAHMDRRARAGLFVVAAAFDPDASVVGVDDATRNGQPQPRAATFELGPAGGM